MRSGAGAEGVIGFPWLDSSNLLVILLSAAYDMCVRPNIPEQPRISNSDTIIVVANILLTVFKALPQLFGLASRWFTTPKSLVIDIDCPFTVLYSYLAFDKLPLLSFINHGHLVNH